jgi:hypothetical protein
VTGGLFRKVPLGIPLAGLSALPILVWFALLPVGIAIPLAAAFGALMCLTLVARTPAAAQRYRQVRASGEDAWVATEQALGVVMAPKAARILLYEPRVWICLSRWLVNAHPAGTDRYFA